MGKSKNTKNYNQCIEECIILAPSLIQDREHLSPSDEQEMLKKFAHDVVEAYKKFEHHVLSQRCMVCDVDLTHDELLAHTSHHFSKCCTTHAEYRYHFNLEPVRIKLGFPPYPENVYFFPDIK